MIIVSWQNNELISFVSAIVWSLTVKDILFLTEMSTASVECCKGWVGESP